MTKRQIQSRIKKQNLTQKQLAKRFKVAQPTLTLFIAGKVKSARLEKAMARVLGMSVAEFRGEERAA